MYKKEKSVIDNLIESAEKENKKINWTVAFILGGIALCILFVLLVYTAGNF